MGDDDVIETTSSKKRAKKGDFNNSLATLKKNKKTNKRLKRGAFPEVANDKTSEVEGGKFEEKFELLDFGTTTLESKNAIEDARKFKPKFPNVKILLLNFNFSSYYMVNVLIIEHMLKTFLTVY